MTPLQFSGDTMSTLINVGDTIPEVTMPVRTDGDWKSI